jgi:hypothetical protein
LIGEETQYDSKAFFHVNINQHTNSACDDLNDGGLRTFSEQVLHKRKKLYTWVGSSYPVHKMLAK